MRPSAVFALGAPLWSVATGFFVDHGKHIHGLRHSPMLFSRGWDPSTIPNGQCGGAKGTKCMEGACCSSLNWCGTSQLHCGSGCQSAFGSCGSPSTPSSGSGTGSGADQAVPSTGNEEANASGFTVASTLTSTLASTVVSTAETPGATGGGGSWNPGGPGNKLQIPTGGFQGANPPAASVNRPSDGGIVTHPNTQDCSSFTGIMQFPGTDASTVSTGALNCQAPAAWPAYEQWLPFDKLWDRLLPALTSPSVCSRAQGNILNTNQNDSVAVIRAAILDQSQKTGLDASFLLSIMMSESNGCTGVVQTGGNPPNPGLFQCYAGAASCNFQGACPAQTVQDMVAQGAGGSDDCANKMVSARDSAGCSKYGLLQAYVEAVAYGLSANKAQAYYWAARIYNSGAWSIDRQNNTNVNLGATGDSDYVKKLASRLVGAISF